MEKTIHFNNRHGQINFAKQNNILHSLICGMIKLLLESGWLYSQIEIEINKVLNPDKVSVYISQRDTTHYVLIIKEN